MKKIICFTILVLICSTNSFAKKDKNKNQDNPLDKISLSGLSWRSIGPSLTSGRISDLAINPDKPFEYSIMNLPTQLVVLLLIQIIPILFGLVPEKITIKDLSHMEMEFINLLTEASLGKIWGLITLNILEIF